MLRNKQWRVAPEQTVVGWMLRLRTRFLGAVVPAAHTQPTMILAAQFAPPNGPVGPFVEYPGFSTGNPVRFYAAPTLLLRQQALGFCVAPTLGRDLRFG